MKKDIHPHYEQCVVTCACGNKFETRSSVPEIKLAVCNVCHPFYTGKKGHVLSEAGRLEKFRRKYAGINYGQNKEEDTEE